MVQGLVQLEYTGKANGNAFDTTSANEAKKQGIFNEKQPYTPVLVMVGKGQVIPGLDEAISQANVGEEKHVSIPSEKAFGQRNPELVKLLPLDVFRQQGIDPVPGLIVELDNRPAKIQSVSGGRVRVDFNHELAGQTLEYDFKILKTFSTPDEKVYAFAAQEFSDAKVSFVEGSCTVKVSLKLADAANIVMKKFRFLENAFAAVPELKTIKFEEEYTK